jgi:DtxR family Mn-dependent transcriptional regulator
VEEIHQAFLHALDQVFDRRLAVRGAHESSAFDTESCDLLLSNSRRAATKATVDWQKLGWDDDFRHEASLPDCQPTPVAVIFRQINGTEGIVTDLIDTTEMYLRTILELEEEGQVPMRARIAERLDQSGPTVSQTVARMERDGLVVVSGDRHLELTKLGRHDAISVMRKHRIAERLLADIIGLEWELVHEEACRWEHVMSDAVELKILSMLDTPDVSPYGNPIPGLDELGFQTNANFKDGVVSILDLPKAIAEQSTFVLKRIGEPAQLDVEFLTQLKSLKILPGSSIQLEFRDNGVLVLPAGKKDGLELGNSLAMHLFVES